MESRESVFTQLSSAINRFAEHKLNKVEMYKECAALIEMADDNEKEERLRIEKFWEENKGKIISARDIPYSNWKCGLDKVSG